MQLIIKDGIVIATHEDHQVIAHRYPDTECIFWYEPIEFEMDKETLDPRSNKQKQDNYKDKRRIAYPNILDQLEMIYNDKKNGTDTFVKALDDIKIMYPKSG